MKKHLATAAALLMGIIALPAQTQLLKDAERALKDGKSPAEVVTLITPAFSDPATASLAQTYYIPGKAMFNEYDQLYALKQFNKLPENGAVTMANDLLGGYGFYMTALPLDSVADAKGKIKTKYSKDIISTIAGHHSDFHDAALAFWEAKDYNGAYNAWQIYLDIAENPVLAAKVGNIPADTIIAEIAFNQGIAAWQADSLHKALASFNYAKNKGYNKKQLYDYSLAIAQNLQDDDAMFDIASEGYRLYGNEDPTYIGFIINKYLVNKQFDQAFALVDQAIADDPANSQYYLVKGILYDNQDKKAEAKQMFAKAIELDPANWQALTQYGRALCEEAYALSDSAPTNPAESEQFYNEKLVPLFKEAAEYLERAYDANNDNEEALRYLENVYYNLHDEAKMQEVQSRH